MKAMIHSAIVIVGAALLGSTVFAEGSKQPVIVNVDNFVRAETAAQFDQTLKLTGGINQFVHLREPTPIDQQSVIRMNRDTLYSAAIVDISKGATLTVSDAGERYLSVMVVNEVELHNCA